MFNSNKSFPIPFTEKVIEISKVLLSSLNVAVTSCTSALGSKFSMTNFIFAYSQIGVGCNCRRKMRIRATEERKLQSINNISKSCEETIREKHENIKIIFYHNNELIKTIGNE